MATPRGAEHRDLEQRLRDLEAQVQQLTSAALRREQLSVEQGDFVVSGGGSVIVKDDGTVQVQHPNGTTSVLLGNMVNEATGAYTGTGMLVQAPDGRDIANFYTDDANGGQNILYDKLGNRIFADDGATGFGLALPHLDVPMHLDTGTVQVATTTQTAFTSLYFGTFVVCSPYLDLACYAYSNSATDCRVRFTIDGANSAAGGSYETAVAGSGTQQFTWRVDLTGYPYGSTHQLRLEARRANGTEAVGVMPYYVRTGQS